MTPTDGKETQVVKHKENLRLSMRFIERIEKQTKRQTLKILLHLHV